MPVYHLSMLEANRNTIKNQNVIQNIIVESKRIDIAYNTVTNCNRLAILTTRKIAAFRETSKPQSSTLHCTLHL